MDVLVFGSPHPCRLFCSTFPLDWFVVRAPLRVAAIRAEAVRVGIRRKEIPIVVRLDGRESGAPHGAANDFRCLVALGR